MEKETIYSSKIKSTGFFRFSDFYKFCYEWLTEETSLFISEDKYKEKLSGASKDVEVEWTGTRKITDYFKFEVKVKFIVLGMTEVEIGKNNEKVKTNRGSVEVGVKGSLIRDYKGKFERNWFQKFSRSVYEAWVIPSRIEQFEDKLISDCDEFLSQAKAYLDLAGKR